MDLRRVATVQTSKEHSSLAQPTFTTFCSSATRSVFTCMLIAINKLINIFWTQSLHSLKQDYGAWSNGHLIPKFETH